MVSPQSVRELYDRAPEPKWFATVDSDHTYAAERSRGDGAGVARTNATRRSEAANG